jgi:hypothetical protein
MPLLYEFADRQREYGGAGARGVLCRHPLRASAMRVPAVRLSRPQNRAAAIGGLCARPNAPEARGRPMSPERLRLSLIQPPRRGKR